MSVVIRTRTGIEPTNDKWTYEGQGDPSLNGLSAGIGSIYVQMDSTPPGDIWTKTGQGDTQWTLQLDLPNSATVLSSDVVAALAGTSGAPSDTNRFVTDSDTRLVGGGGGGGGAGLPSMFVSTVQSLTGDGSTDDGPALATLIGTTMSNSGTIYFTPGKTYRIATNTTIPAGVTLWLPQGAVLKADGATLTIRGAIRAGLYSIFQYANGGAVLFTATNAEAAGKRALQNTEVYPEWWGAVADGTTDDSTAINNCITAISGLPAATSGSRWASAMIRLSQGSYRVNQTIRVASLHGLRIEGAGYQACNIVWEGAGATGTASSGSTTTLVDSTKSWTANQYAPGATTLWWAFIFAGTGKNQWAQILSNTATALTFNSAVSVAPDNTSQYYVVPQAVLDLDGAFDCQLQNFSVKGGSSNTQYVRHGIYYHWLGSVSAASSSRLKGHDVQVTGVTLDAAWQLGGVDTAELNQADMVGLFGCQALGSWSSAETAGRYQSGFKFGSGVFSNPLNYSCYDCESVGYNAGVSVSSTNVNWYGGTIQSNGADIFILNGVQGYSNFEGFRSENSQRLFDSFSSQSVQANVRLANIEFALNNFANHETTGLPELIYADIAGNLEVRNIRATAGALTAQSVSSATSTTATSTGWSLPTTNGGVTGWNALITAGTGAGQRQTVTTNTATQITVGAWQNGITPDATSQIQLYPAPRIAIASTISLSGGDLAFQGTPAEAAVAQVAGGAARGRVDNYSELDINSNGVGTSLVSLTFGGTSNVLPKATQAFAVINSTPDAILTRHKAATLGTTALEAASLRALGYGAVPAPFVQAGSGSGSTSYTYFFVARDGAGNKLGLASGGTTITNRPATLAYNTASNTVWLPNGNHVPAVAYDILRGDTAHSVALNVPWYKFPYTDYRSTTDAYTAPASDSTGALIVDGNATIGGTINSATVTTATIPTSSQLSGLTGGGDTSLHFHSADRARSNHTGTQSLSTIAGGTATGSGYTLPDLTVSGLLTANGGISGTLSQTSITANYTALTTDQIILADATAGNIVVTLPAASAEGNRELFIKKIDASVNTVRVAAAGTDTIDGAASVTLASQYAWIDIIADGTAKWNISSASTTAVSVAASSVTPGSFANGGYTFPSTLTVSGNVTLSNTGALSVNGNANFNQQITQRQFNAGNSGTALTLNSSNGNWQKTTLTGNCTLTITAPGNPWPLTLWLTQDATGSRTVTWPATVKWAGGTPPTLTTTASKTDIITLRWDTTSFWGEVVGLNY